jgi:hypothetical protein
MFWILQNPPHRLRVKQSAEYSEWQRDRDTSSTGPHCQNIPERPE